MNHISKALENTGICPIPVSLFPLISRSDEPEIKANSIPIHFHLVEMVEGTGAMLISVLPSWNILVSLYGSRWLPCSLQPVRSSQRKCWTLWNIQHLIGIWMDQGVNLLSLKNLFVKPIWEDGSLGLMRLRFFGRDKKFIRNMKKFYRKIHFVEKFIRRQGIQSFHPWW